MTVFPLRKYLYESFSPIAAFGRLAPASPPAETATYWRIFPDASLTAYVIGAALTPAPQKNRQIGFPPVLASIASK